MGELNLISYSQREGLAYKSPNQLRKAEIHIYMGTDKRNLKKVVQDIQTFSFWNLGKKT